MPIFDLENVMRKFLILTLTATVLCIGLTAAPPVRADWDAAAEAKDEARRKAARAAAAKRDAENAARRAEAQAEMDRKMAASYRKTYGKRADGMSDAQVVAAGRQWDLERAKQANQQLAETIKSLPPEQRAMAEQMMKQAAAQK